MSQTKVEGKLTGWCAQHDETDFRPRPARSYELVTLSGAESVGIVRVLMSLDDPSPEVRRSVESAAAWFEAAKVTGIRVNLEKDAKGPIWARFYVIGTNEPVFSDRDGVPKSALADIGYAWYGTWAQKLLDAEYPAWKKRVARR
ncbi:MAG: pectate lyase [Gemmataceae bacterium]